MGLARLRGTIYTTLREARAGGGAATSRRVVEMLVVEAKPERGQCPTSAGKEALGVPVTVTLTLARERNCHAPGQEWRRGETPGTGAPGGRVPGHDVMMVSQVERVITRVRRVQVAGQDCYEIKPRARSPLVSHFQHQRCDPSRQEGCPLVPLAGRRDRNQNACKKQRCPRLPTTRMSNRDRTSQPTKGKPLPAPPLPHCSPLFKAISSRSGAVGSLSDTSPPFPSPLRA
eukprot:371151-Rhodomonas_salina.1